MHPYLLCLGAYKPPSISDESFETDCTLGLDRISEKYEHYILLGELNFDMLDKSKYWYKDQESIQSSTTPDPGYQWESDKLTEDTTNESQEVSPFPAGESSNLNSVCDIFNLINTVKEPTCFTSGNKPSLVDVILTCSSECIGKTLNFNCELSDVTILLPFN